MSQSEFLELLKQGRPVLLRHNIGNVEKIWVVTPPTRLYSNGQLHYAYLQDYASHKADKWEVIPFDPHFHGRHITSTIVVDYFPPDNSSPSTTEEEQQQSPTKTEGESLMRFFSSSQHDNNSPWYSRYDDQE